MFRRQTLSALAALSLLGAGSGAAYAQPMPNPDPHDARPGAYTIDSSISRVLFAISHLGFTTWYGEFTGATGTLDLNVADPARSALDITIPAASVSTSNAKLDGELKSAQWFDVAKFSSIHFRSTTITVTGPGRADIVGNLTFHGVTRSVMLQAKFNAAGMDPIEKVYTSGFEVSGDIKRSDFGVNTYLPLIGDNVHLIISAAFLKAP